jgi:hypothetical protein
VWEGPGRLRNAWTQGISDDCLSFVCRLSVVCLPPAWEYLTIVCRLSAARGRISHDCLSFVCRVPAVTGHPSASFGHAELAS